ncbi:putative multidrug ABC transporter ATP-binding protein YbhF [Phycisphaerales bacterium]|nr:putative multidrug ABC transporter ATP-binding protein YbhF [Phycisphaerales bacterium]
MSEALIRLEKLTKRFGSGAGSILAVDGVTFQVSPGEVLGFLGPNGAGKSTTMKMVTGYLAPTSGKAVVCGHDVVEDPIAVKEKVGYLPEGAPAYPDMTPESFLRFVADVRRLKGEARRAAIDKAVARAQLQGVMRQPIDTLSKGFKRRVGLAQAILHEPPVLIMDEPTDGLDPNQKHEVRKLIREMAREGGRAIVLSTHILEEVEAVCTRAIVIARGKVVADGTPAELAGRSRYHNAVTITLIPPAGVMVFDELSRLPGVAGVEDGGAMQSADGVKVTCTVLPHKGREIAGQVGQFVRTKNWRMDLLRVEGGRLDDVFRDLTANKSKG